MKNICCFAGHRQIDEYKMIYTRLEDLLERLIESKTVTEFWVGNYGQFDRMAANIVHRMKFRYGTVLKLIVPYITFEMKKHRFHYSRIFDSIEIADMPADTPQKLKIIKCNEYIVNNCTHMISHVTHTSGGATRTLEYAEKNKLKIYRI